MDLNIIQYKYWKIELDIISILRIWVYGMPILKNGIECNTKEWTSI